MAVAIALFFMVGFLTCLNDVIIPHLKSIFELSYAEAMLVQVAFFSSYFVFSYPGGKLVDLFGYKRAMVSGLLIMAAGALGFLPAASYASFGLFLAALVVLAAGMTTVQVAANPYVTIVGPAATASSRLNLAQAFNSVGTFIAPFLGAMFILKGAKPLTPERLRNMSEAARQLYRATEASSVRLPYIGMALVLCLLAVGLAAIRLKPQGVETNVTRDFRPGAYAEATSHSDSLWRHPWLLAGAIGIFTYVGAEVSIGSLLVNFMGLPNVAGLPEAAAAKYLMVYWGGAMVGRFIGSAVLQRLPTGPVLEFAALSSFGLVVLSVMTHGHLAMYGALAVGFCNSIMFPSIFSLGIQGLGPFTSKGSSLMIAAIVGGAIIPLATGRLADAVGLHLAFLLPSLCYVYIACFGFASKRRTLSC
ncbi:FHS family L-fucose permease-like MFS transporter [Granulicella aggregans]|uniref:FHS family L-fucose permease-like MFS transporter n=2 Tax=Granulicella aggregans TaxID=474949 RepID=A0A7W7ZE86_9BACT|nr:sugar MFS transporter [Granulicella aggregans]MBB5057731.1 FHS family L-fucose permease-like MFS transporter [Granulicella aggregans]